jgi:hypothetical protein
MRVGLGLWNHKWATIITETLLFVFSVLLYINATAARNKTGVWSLFALIAFLLVFYFMSAFGPPPENVEMIAWTGIAQWLFVAWAWWIDKNRR